MSSGGGGLRAYAERRAQMRGSAKTESKLAASAGARAVRLLFHNKLDPPTHTCCVQFFFFLWETIRRIGGEKTNEKKKQVFFFSLFGGVKRKPLSCRQHARCRHFRMYLLLHAHRTTDAHRSPARAHTRTFTLNNNTLRLHSYHFHAPPCPAQKKN